MIKVTVENFEYEYPKATRFDVSGDYLNVYEGSDLVAIYAIGEWSHVEKFEAPMANANTFQNLAGVTFSNACKCGACDPQLAVQARHRED